MSSIFKRKARQLEEAKLTLLRVTAIAPNDLCPLIASVSDDIWAKNYKAAEVRCKQHADELDRCPAVRDLLCAILPEYARFVEVRKSAKT